MLRQAVFDRIRLSNLEQNLGLYGIHLYCNGEEAAFQFRSDDRVNLHSASKTFLSVAVGICLDERLAAEPSLIYFRNLRGTLPPAVKITLGISCTCPPGKRKIFSFSTMNKNSVSTGSFGQMQMKNKPGTHFIIVMHLYFRTGGGKGYREKRQGFSCAAAV